MNSALPIAVASAIVLGPGVAAAQTYGVASNAQGSSGYTMASAVAKVAVEKASMQAVVQPYAGTSTYIPLLNQGKIDFGVMNSIEAALAYAGQDTFKDNPNKNLRIAARLNDFYVSFVVRKDSGINTLADLKGKRVAWGYASQTIVLPLVRATMANAGMTENDFKPVLVPNLTKAAEALSSNAVDASFHVVGTAAVTQIDASVGGVRYLPFSTNSVRVKAMQDIVPGTLVRVMQPGPGTVGVGTPTPMMSYPTILAVGANVPDNAVYGMVKALQSNKEALVAVHALFESFDPQGMTFPIDVPYHPGAIKFYEETKQWPPKG